VNPIREIAYGYRLVKSSAITGIAFAVLLADVLTGFNRIDRGGRWIAVVVLLLGSASTFYYWRRFSGKRSLPRKRVYHGEAEARPFNPINKLPPRREG
jgi:hypothetical protein